MTLTAVVTKGAFQENKTFTIHVLGQEDALSIWCEDGICHYYIDLPQGSAATLIIAGYDADGRILHTTVVENVKSSGNVNLQIASQYRAFLLEQNTLTPLCPACYFQQYNIG